MFYRLMPTLIEQGYVYIAESPLYEIALQGKKEKSYFAYTEAEKAEIMEKLEGEKYTIQRSKGLGENQPDMMWQTTMNPETRRLIKVVPENDATLVQAKFELLLGDNRQGRKEHIAKNGKQYIDLTDIS
ncbi:MAG: DNA topoisomerase, partial [Clostridia bacterium]|nr:DNA topoisomerase [Clostridia bacterium]